MGMDVYGKNPTSETGHYFRANVWWWRPLAEYITAAHADLTSACTYWQSNDGDGLDAADARALGEALEASITAGTVAEYAVLRAQQLEQLPQTRCDLCAGTGRRTDAIGIKYGYDKPHDPTTGRGGCNACNGSGARDPWEWSYSFSVECVAEFAAFAKDSGGFEIC